MIEAVHAEVFVTASGPDQCQRDDQATIPQRTSIGTETMAFGTTLTKADAVLSDGTAPCILDFTKLGLIARQRANEQFWIGKMKTFHIMILFHQCY